MVTTTRGGTLKRCATNDASAGASSVFVVPQQLSYPVDCYNYPTLVCCALQYSCVQRCGCYVCRKWHFPVCRRARMCVVVLEQNKTKKHTHRNREQEKGREAALARNNEKREEENCTHDDTIEYSSSKRETYAIFIEDEDCVSRVKSAKNRKWKLYELKCSKWNISRTKHV